MRLRPTHAVPLRSPALVSCLGGRWRVLGVGLLLASGVACGDSATDPFAGGNEAIRAALTIDPDALPDYVRDPLPAFFDAAILAREDRTQGAPLTNAL